jgi:hypothetical protein
MDFATLYAVLTGAGVGVVGLSVYNKYKASQLERLVSRTAKDVSALSAAMKPDQASLDAAVAAKAALEAKVASLKNQVSSLT